MNTAPRIIGSHLYFFRDGAEYTLPQAGIAGRNNKPDETDPAWIDMGVINNLGITPDSNEVEIMAPSPGRLVRYDVISNQFGETVKWECEELSFLSYELAFHAKPLSAAGGQYNPGSGKTVKGWIKIEQYDQDADDDSDPLNVVDYYVHLKLDGELKFDENHVKTPMVAKTLRSPLNTGNLIP